MEGTVCLIIKGNKILMKLALRGISEGRWNFPVGKLEAGETPREGNSREVLEETGLMVSDAQYHGKLFFAFENRHEKDWYVHIFSTRSFSGKTTESPEGPLQWFDVAAMPIERMWSGDRIWFPAVLAGKTVSGSFTYDEKGQNLLRHELKTESPAATL
jgi:8-oxo-dGTP diphosphatase